MRNYSCHKYPIYYRPILLLLFLCACELITFPLNAQNKYIDSLKLELNRKDLPDSIRVEVLVELGDNLYPSDKQEAIRYFRELFHFAHGKESPFWEGRAYSGIGNVYYEKSSYDCAMYYYLLADSLYAMDTSLISKESRVTNKAGMANIEIMRNNYELAAQNYTHAINIMIESDAKNKWKVIGNLYVGLGSIYHDLGQFNKALDYDLKALDFHKKQKNNLLLTGSLELYVAGDYVDLKEMEIAKSHLISADSISKQLQSSAFFYQLYSQWGRFYQKSSLLPQAIKNFQKSLSYANESDSKFKVMNAYRMIGFAYRDMKEFSKSAEALRKALSLTIELNNFRLKSETLKKLAEVESKQHHDRESVQYYQQYISLSDSLNETDIKKKISEIEIGYQAKQKQDSILVLQKNNQIQLLALNKRRNLNYVLLTGFVFLILIGILIYRNFRHRHYILKQNELLHKRRIQELEKEHQLVAMQSVLKGQEEERSRLAKDLHDGVGGLLSGVKLSLSTMKGNVFLSEQHAQSVNRVIEQLDQSIAELRRVSHNMMPEALVKYGLKEALENYCENINLSGTLKVQLQSYGLENRMDQNTEIILYRIVQELLNNVIKH
ncbi:MAG: tetratricopeptide repeat-containing sensor histidine kinase, partial [Chitinophagaceae bacterium]